MPLHAGAAALLFALVHIFVGQLRFLEGVPRSRWLSFAGGVAVAYVFMHLLPDLVEHQKSLSEQAREAGGRISGRVVFLIALAGLSVFYGLERWVRVSRARRGGSGDDERAEDHVFWLHIGSFGIYNLLIGYLLLHREDTGVLSLVLFAVAIGLHFLTNDFGLREHHKELYDHRGRWVIAACVILGFAVGLFVELSEWLVAILFAFVAGAIILNVLKEELPEDRKSRFLPFAGGAAGYAALLMLTA